MYNFNTALLSVLVLVVKISWMEIQGFFSFSKEQMTEFIGGECIPLGNANVKEDFVCS